MARFSFAILLLCSANFVFAEAEQFVYDDHGRRDPLWRLISPGGAILSYETDVLISDMTLEGIIFDPQGKSLAIINSNIIRPNDRISLYTVQKIEPNRVTLIKGQESFVLELKKEE